MAASIASRFGCKPAIKPGHTGQFDVIVDGKTIYSKGQTGRFPNDGEIEAGIEKLSPRS